MASFIEAEKIGTYAGRDLQASMLYATRGKDPMLFALHEHPEDISSVCANEPNETATFIKEAMKMSGRSVRAQRVEECKSAPNGSLSTLVFDDKTSYDRMEDSCAAFFALLGKGKIEVEDSLWSYDEKYAALLRDLGDFSKKLKPVIAKDSIIIPKELKEYLAKREGLATYQRIFVDCLGNTRFRNISNLKYEHDGGVNVDEKRYDDWRLNGLEWHYFKQPPSRYLVGVFEDEEGRKCGIDLFESEMTLSSIKPWISDLDQKIVMKGAENHFRKNQKGCDGCIRTLIENSGVNIDGALINGTLKRRELKHAKSILMLTPETSFLKMGPESKTVAAPYNWAFGLGLKNSNIIKVKGVKPPQEKTESEVEHPYWV